MVQHPDTDHIGDGPQLIRHFVSQPGVHIYDGVGIVLSGLIRHVFHVDAVVRKGGHGLPLGGGYAGCIVPGDSVVVCDCRTACAGGFPL